MRTWPVLALGAALVVLGAADGSLPLVAIGTGVFLLGSWWLLARLRSTRDAARLERRARAASADTDRDGQ